MIRSRSYLLASALGGAVLAVFVVLLAWTARAAAPAAQAPAERRFTFFYTAEAHGTLEPCGCTTEA